MRSLFLAAVGVSLTLGLPAVAQTSTPSSPAVSTSQPPATANPNSTMTSQKMTSDLEKAGFTNIKVIPESFFVRATNKGGQPVMMMVTPDSFTEIIQVRSGTTEKSGSSTNPAPSGTTTHK